MDFEDKPVKMIDAKTQMIIDQILAYHGMGMNEYQRLAHATVKYPEDMKVIYPTLGLCGEAGETAEKIKKWIRDDNRVMTPERLELIKKEMGDVLWYLAALTYDLGLTLDEVARHNIQKLQDRRERGVIKGTGDIR